MYTQLSWRKDETKSVISCGGIFFLHGVLLSTRAPSPEEPTI